MREEKEKDLLKRHQGCNLHYCLPKRDKFERARDDQWLRQRKSRNSPWPAAEVEAHALRKLQWRLHCRERRKRLTKLTVAHIIVIQGRRSKVKAAFLSPSLEKQFCLFDFSAGWLTMSDSDRIDEVALILLPWSCGWAPSIWKKKKWTSQFSLPALIN